MITKSYDVERVRYIGFIVDEFLPSISKCLRFQCMPRALVSGWPSGSSVFPMRFQWIADYINQTHPYNLHYELYRPWRKYAGIIFLKSMGEACAELANRLKSRGLKTIFDSNVDYFTPVSGTFYYDGMAPTPDQRHAAIEMAELCDAVIGDSQYLTEIASEYNSRAKWISDNIRNDLIESDVSWKPKKGLKLPFLWSGQAIKLFELLRIKDILIEYSNELNLILITNSIDELDKWYSPYKNEFYDLLNRVSNEIIPFTSIEDLMGIYSSGGVCISPRFMDNKYNQGHTEWKITLAMARGRIALCSDVPSYVDVFERAKGVGIRVCRNDEEWRRAFEEVLDSEFDWEKEQHGAIKVVGNYYSTELVAQMHADFLNEIL